jgi:carbohydrate kinase (thermoresistant glucokinase family)
MRPSSPRRFVVMGVAGCGKSTIAAALARELAVEFIEGDAFHTPDNVRKMAAGIALTDQDRAPWLATLSECLRNARNAQRGLVMTCSALRRGYRDVLRRGDPDAQFIFLDGPKDLIAERLASRTGHYMPSSLLDSQFAALERPEPDEGAWLCDISDSPDDIVADLVARITRS